MLVAEQRARARHRETPDEVDGQDGAREEETSQVASVGESEGAGTGDDRRAVRRAEEAT